MKPRRVMAGTLPFVDGVWAFRLIELRDSDGTFWHWVTIGRIA